MGLPNKTQAEFSGVVYRIRNLVNGKVYVGSTLDLAKRRRAHLSRLRRSKHHCQPLQASFGRHGEAAFVFEVIEVAADVPHMLERETHWLVATKCLDRQFGYNVCTHAGGAFGYRHTPEAKARIAAAQRGTKRPGRVRSEEAKRKNGDAHRGMKRSAETRRRMSAAATLRYSSRPPKPPKGPHGLRGRPKSEQHRAAMSVAAKHRAPRLRRPDGVFISGAMQ